MPPDSPFLLGVKGTFTNEIVEILGARLMTTNASRPILTTRLLSVTTRAEVLGDVPLVKLVSEFRQ